MNVKNTIKSLIFFDKENVFVYTWMKGFLFLQKQNMWFNISEYQNQVIKEIETKLTNVNKLYLEVVGNCIDQSAFSNVINEFPADLWKRVFSHFKYEMEIFFCVRAEDILDEDKERPGGKEFKDFLMIYLKKIENQYGTKPHVVINGIDVENMYDLVFSFETYFQKQGYRVWEKYKVRAYETSMSRLLSEDGFGNDDHIPTSKKLILVCGLTPESGKLTTAAAQIYQDKEIWIESGYAKLDPIPDYSEDKNSARNIAAQALDICALHQYGLDDIIQNRNVLEKSEEKLKFLKKFSESLKIAVPEKIEDFTVGKLTIEENIWNNVSKFLQEEIEKADSPTLQEKLIELKEKI